MKVMFFQLVRTNKYLPARPVVVETVLDGALLPTLLTAVIVMMYLLSSSTGVVELFMMV